MTVIWGLRDIKKRIRDSVITIGVFDGVHVGHRLIIRKVVERARQLNFKSVVVTFDPHPLKVLDRTVKVPSLISLKHRIGMIKALGVDYVVVIKFTRSFSRISPERFIKNVLIDKLGLREIFVGENFYFGRNARAGIDRLEGLSGNLGFNSGRVRPVKIEGKIVSSSIIRRSIEDGDLASASKYLGHRVSLLGTVVSGTRLARILGYPTANINPHHEVVPPAGVYAVRIVYNRRYYNGILNIGLRPTFYGPSDREPAIEVHIFGFNKRIYGKDLEIFFIKKLRDEVKFRNKDELIAQIEKDAERARSILSFTKQDNCVNILKSKR
jgi:riboflavin kinase/FMN adenylyltransferase